MFQLSEEEFDILKSQFVTSCWGGRRRALPYAFTEQGVAILSSVLRSHRRVSVNIATMRTIVQFRRILSGNKLLPDKIQRMERKYGDQFQQIFPDYTVSDDATCWLLSVFSAVREDMHA